MPDNQESFVHLHCHSEFSLLDGLSRIDQLVERAVELGQPAIALTDHGAMYGTMPFYSAAKKADIKPIIGIETYLAARGMRDRDANLDKNRFHMLLLAENQTGYLNLLKIASAAQLEGYYYKPRIDREFMAQHSEGLIATTGCMAAEIPKAIANGQMKQAHELMGEYVDIFGRERLFVELQEHSIPELTEINKTLLDMAKRYDLRFLATNDVHYTLAEDAKAHEVLLCIQTSSTVQAPKLTFSDRGYYLKSYAEMAALFGDVPGALSNSILIAEMCDVNLDTEGYHLPHFPVPEGFDAPGYLRHLCEKGLVWRYGETRAKTDEHLRERLAYELRIINRMGFDTYFLIVWDMCEFAIRSDAWWEANQDPYPYRDYSEWKENDIWFNVRGSGAGSVVAYTLGITSLDPLANGLIFERFLNPGRVSMPDIDLDYPDDRRHEMVEYTKRKYGHEKVAQIITFGTMGARAAIRDVGRAMDMELERVDSLARMVPAIAGKPVKIKNVLDKEHEFYSVDLDRLYRSDELVRTLLDTAQNLEGVSRHASSHAAGVIISDRSLHEYVPLNRPTSGDEGLGGIDRVTQWPMEIVESIGLLKVDFLGLSTLSVMRLAARLIEARHGVRYNMDNIPYDAGHVGPDPSKSPEALFDMLGQGEVSGVFQVEGEGMRRLMMTMKPRRFDHITAAISLFRPGPMENIPEYIRRMHSAIFENKDLAQYHTADLEPILKDTYGILVYQEQIIRIASELAGYEPGEADMIRKAVSKKKPELMDEHKTKFTHGAMARGYTNQVCEAIWSDVEYFARYGFNKAHAADYAKVTGQTAFLKAHYPVEYMAAMLTVERAKTDKITRYLADARRMGISVLAPDINESGLDFRIQQGQTDNHSGSRASYDFPVPPGSAIRYGMGAIKNVGEGAIETVLAARDQSGPFVSLEDFCERVDLRQLNKRVVECLIKAGAFDQFADREQILAVLDRMMTHSSSTWQAKDVGQGSLFDLFDFTDESASQSALFEPPPTYTAVPARERLNWEKDLLGVYVSEHPLQRVTANLQHAVTCMCDEVPERVGRNVALAGMVAGARSIFTKKGQRMAFITLEDLQGACDVTVFPRLFEATPAHLLEEGAVVLVRGKVESRDERINVLAEEITDTFTYAKSANGDSLPDFAAPPASTWDSEPPPLNDFIEPPADEMDDMEPTGFAPSVTLSPPIPSAPPISDLRSSSSDLRPDPPSNGGNGPTRPPSALRPPPSAPQPPPEPRLLRARFKRSPDPAADKTRLAAAIAAFRRYEGRDRFKLVLEAPDGREKWELDFVNETTRYCDDLTAELERLLGAACLQVEGVQALG